MNSAEAKAALQEAERFMAYFAGETDNTFVGPGTPKSCLATIRSILSALEPVAEAKAEPVAQAQGRESALHGALISRIMPETKDMTDAEAEALGTDLLGIIRAYAPVAVTEQMITAACEEAGWVVEPGAFELDAGEAERITKAYRSGMHDILRAALEAARDSGDSGEKA